MVYFVYLLLVLFIFLVSFNHIEHIEVLKRDYPKYAGFFKSSKFRRSFVKKIKLEDQIELLKEELSAVNLDVEFFIDKIEQKKGGVD